MKILLALLGAILVATESVPTRADEFEFQNSLSDVDGGTLEILRPIQGASAGKALYFQGGQLRSVDSLDRHSQFCRLLVGRTVSGTIPAGRIRLRRMEGGVVGINGIGARGIGFVPVSRGPSALVDLACFDELGGDQLVHYGAIHEQLGSFARFTRDRAALSLKIAEPLGAKRAAAAAGASAGSGHPSDFRPAH